MVKTILSYGGGVNSCALIIELVKRNMKPDYVLFADTGSEMPETYQHIKEVMQPWFKEHDIKFVTVKSRYGCLYDYYFNHKWIPFRQYRSCTDKFKKLPLGQFSKEFKEEGVISLVGISFEEQGRALRMQPIYKWITNKFPLIEWKIDRLGCIDIIKAEGLKVPVKSGCFLCPFQSKKMWITLLKNHPELYAKARLLEEQSKFWPTAGLTFDYSLKEYEDAERSQTKLDSNTGAWICDGWCMT